MSKGIYCQSQFVSCRNDSGKMWKRINSSMNSKEERLCLAEKFVDPVKSN